MRVAPAATSSRPVGWIWGVLVAVAAPVTRSVPGPARLPPVMVKVCTTESSVTVSEPVSASEPAGASISVTVTLVLIAGTFRPGVPGMHTRDDGPGTDPCTQLALSVHSVPVVLSVPFQVCVGAAHAAACAPPAKTTPATTASVPTPSTHRSA